MESILLKIMIRQPYMHLSSIPKPFCLTKDELDDHFNYPLLNEVEKVNDYFRKRLFNLLTKS